MAPFFLVWFGFFCRLTKFSNKKIRLEAWSLKYRGFTCLQELTDSWSADQIGLKHRNSQTALPEVPAGIYLGVFILTGLKTLNLF